MVEQCEGVVEQCEGVVEQCEGSDYLPCITVLNRLPSQHSSLLHQARIVDELGDCIPGLIPAKHLQEK